MEVTKSAIEYHYYSSIKLKNLARSRLKSKGKDWKEKSKENEAFRISKMKRLGMDVCPNCNGKGFIITKQQAHYAPRKKNCMRQIDKKIFETETYFTRCECGADVRQSMFQRVDETRGPQQRTSVTFVMGFCRCGNLFFSEWPMIERYLIEETREWGVPYDDTRTDEEHRARAKANQ